MDRLRNTTCVSRFSVLFFITTLLVNTRTSYLFFSNHATSNISIVQFFVSAVGSVVEPEPDFLAGAGAGQKAPALGCCYLA